MGNILRSTSLSFIRRSPRTVTFSFSTTLQTVWFWSARARSRRHLARLDERLLRDIGVARESAKAEVAKPFWED